MTSMSSRELVTGFGLTGYQEPAALGRELRRTPRAFTIFSREVQKVIVSCEAHQEPGRL
jgi:hypothetical protein